jgi:signal transduction histidine kinase
MKKISLCLDITPSVPATVFSDPKRLRQVIFNLIGNALKFTYHGEVRLMVDFDPASSHLVAAVSDTGVGIHEAELTQLFRFFGKLSRTSEINKSGMGLGLTISKKIVEQLSGNIFVNSKPGVGSTFTFKIPIDQFHPTVTMTDIEENLEFHQIMLTESNERLHIGEFRNL